MFHEQIVVECLRPLRQWCNSRTLPERLQTGLQLAQTANVSLGSDSAVGCRPQNRHWGYRRKPDLLIGVQGGL